MKRLLPVLMGVVVLLLSSTEGWSLALCKGSPTSDYNKTKSWTDCFGTYIHSDGDKFVGQFKDGKRHGPGTKIYANGDKFVGQFKDGKKHGQGTYDGVGGEYVGEYRDGKKNGRFR